MRSGSGTSPTPPGGVDGEENPSGGTTPRMRLFLQSGHGYRALIPGGPAPVPGSSGRSFAGASPPAGEQYGGRLGAGDLRSDRRGARDRRSSSAPGGGRAADRPARTRGLDDVDGASGQAEGAVIDRQRENKAVAVDRPEHPAPVAPESCVSEGTAMPTIVRSRRAMSILQPRRAARPTTECRPAGPGSLPSCILLVHRSGIHTDGAIIVRVTSVVSRTMFPTALYNSTNEGINFCR